MLKRKSFRYVSGGKIYERETNTDERDYKICKKGVDTELK